MRACHRVPKESVRDHTTRSSRQILVGTHMDRGPWETRTVATRLGAGSLQVALK